MITKDQLFKALFTRSMITITGMVEGSKSIYPRTVVGIVNGLEHEDGSGNSFNVQLISGCDIITIYVKASNPDEILVSEMPRIGKPLKGYKRGGQCWLTTEIVDIQKMNKSFPALENYKPIQWFLCRTQSGSLYEALQALPL